MDITTNMNGNRLLAAFLCVTCLTTCVAMAASARTETGSQPGARPESSKKIQTGDSDQSDKSARIFKLRSTVVEGVSKGLTERNIAILQRFASLTRFEAGYEGEEPLTTSFDAAMSGFFERIFDSYTPDVGHKLDCRNASFCLLPVEFRREAFPYWYFVFEQLDGGWQWTGMLISGRRRQE
jgi:hypothetical protein